MRFISLLRQLGQATMAILKISLLFVLAAVAIADDSCPAANEISPCTCDGEGLNCMGDRTLDEVKKAFRANFKYGGVRAVWVQGTPISKIPGDLFGNIKSQQFYIEVNNISSVDFNAFSASKKTLKTLSLFGNKLDSIDYSGLTDYEALEVFNLGRNEITSIPSSAFDSKSLYVIILAQNKISSIGMNAFANLPNLGKLEMSLNQLKTLGPMSLAFKSHSAGLQVNLAANQISSVSDSAFQGLAPQAMFLSQNKLTSLPYSAFGNLVTRIGQKRGFLEVSANPLSCSGCDYSWIVTNKQILHDKLIGFTCVDGRSLSHLTKSGINC